MFSFTDTRGHSSQFHKTGSVELNTEYSTHKKALWLIMLKLLGVLVMVAVGAAIALPTLLEYEFPLWQAIVITAGAMLVYTGIAFFIRPEPNTDNMGWGGGLGNDPFQYSDNINRFLWKAHCVLGPGRFTAETFLDLCALVGLAKGEEVVGDRAGQSPIASCGGESGPGAFDPTRPIAPLDPARLAQSSGNFVAGQIQLDSQRFMNCPQPPAAAR
jgi:hypothetical protein